MSKFKIGDQVKCYGGSITPGQQCSTGAKGELGRVALVVEESKWIGVTFDNGHEGIYKFHMKQCRKVKDTAPRELWISSKLDLTKNFVFIGEVVCSPSPIPGGIKFLEVKP